MTWQRFFRRQRKDHEIQAEMDVFLAEETAENLSRGMSPDEARRRAYVKLGNMETVRESLWQQNSLSIEKLWRDLKYSARGLKRSPGFAVIAIAVMALCIGAATSLFTIVRSVLLRPLPFLDPDHLTMVYEHFRSAADNADSFNYNVVSPADFYDWRSQTHGFEDMAVWRWSQFNLTGEHAELPEYITAAAASWNMFNLLGVQPVVGRTFAEAEDHPDSNVVVLTWSLFERRFSGDRSLIGRQIHLDGKPVTVIGVLPPAFSYPDATVQLWVPYQGGVRSGIPASPRLPSEPRNRPLAPGCQPRQRHQPGGIGAIQSPPAIPQCARRRRCSPSLHRRRSRPQR